jgi:UDP-2-acetamido-3-amino-2,3-dideoxy-glucuronate N-acetyltransferase
MNARRPRIGVVGAGKWGMNLVRTCARLGYLAAACDPDLHPLEEVRSSFDDVKLFTDYTAMLDLGKLGAVAIAAPVQYHAAYALRALEAGLDVFVEKPLALSVNDGQAIVDAAERTGRKLVVGHVLLYHPVVQSMLKLVASGTIGEVRHVRSRRLSWGRLRSHENVWWSFAPHDVALMLELMGEEPESATGAAGAFVRPHIADVAHADFRFSGGRTAHIEVSWIDPVRCSQVDVFGSTGTLTFTDGRDGGQLLLTPCGDRLTSRGEPELYCGEPLRLETPAGSPLDNEIEAFARAVRGGRMPPTDGREGLAVVRTLAMVPELALAQPAEAFAQ